MPTRRRSTAARRRPAPARVVSGAGWKDLISGLNNFLKKSRILSTVGSMIPHPGVQMAARAAGTLGYGRKRRAPAKRRGGALRLAGGALRAAGGRRRTR